jgi:hypothetical protein
MESQRGPKINPRLGVSVRPLILEGDSLINHSTAGRLLNGNPGGDPD